MKEIRLRKLVACANVRGDAWGTSTTSERPRHPCPKVSPVAGQVPMVEAQAHTRDMGEPGPEALCYR